MGEARERAARVSSAAQPLSGLARVAAVVSDLMLASRVTTALSAAGHQVSQEPVLPAKLDGFDLIVADLDATDPERLAETDAPVLAFYRHTDAETKARAEAAGLALIVPRSRLVRELPELAARLLD